MSVRRADTRKISTAGTSALMEDRQDCGSPAKWNHATVTTSRHRQKMNDACVFCAIARGQAPARVLGEGADFLIITPLNPVVPGHALVIPRDHVSDFMDVPYKSGRLMSAAATFAKESNYGPCNLITSAGAEATQTVFHLHLHIFPRKADDGLTLPWTDLGLATEVDEDFELLKPHQRASGLKPMRYTRERLVGPWSEWAVKEKA